MSPLKSHCPVSTASCWCVIINYEDDMLWLINEINETPYSRFDFKTKLTTNLCDIIAVSMPQTSIHSTSKCHQNSTVWKLQWFILLFKMMSLYGFWKEGKRLADDILVKNYGGWYKEFVSVSHMHKICNSQFPPS